MSELPSSNERPLDSAFAALESGFLVGNGRFTLVRLLGRGGMGVVWLAHDESLREDVALKFLPSEIRYDAVALDDLRRETSRARKLTHPNIVRIHDLYKDEREAFISMEFVDGPNLSDLRLEQPERVFTWEFLEPIVKQLCEALDYAHGEKVVHRDLKPANLMLHSRGRLKLSDFGIAAQVSDSVSRVSMLRHGQSGTVTDMSPQQMDGKLPQVSDDIYALGATLYELLTSKPPFFTGDIAHQVRNLLPPSIDERLAELGIENPVPKSVAALIMACLGKSPEQRPASARAVAEWIGFQPTTTAAIVSRDDSPSSKRVSEQKIATTTPASTPVLSSSVDTIEEEDSPDTSASQMPSPSWAVTQEEPAPHFVESDTGPITDEKPRARWRTTWLVAAVAIVLVAGLGFGGLAWWILNRRAADGSKNSGATTTQFSASEFLREEHVITGHRAAISSVAFSPDQSFLISGSADGTVRVYETSHGELKWSANADVGAVNAVSASRENKFVAVGGANGLIRLFALPSGNVFQTLRVHSSPVTSVAFSSAGPYIASGDDAGTIAVWDYEQGGITAHWNGHNMAVQTLAFSPRGKWLASGGPDLTVRVWNVPDGALVKVLSGHKGNVWSVAFSPDGLNLASSSRDRSARLWNTTTLAVRKTIQFRSDANLMRGLAFSPDSKFLATGAARNVKVFKLSSFTVRETERVLKATALVRTVAFSPDGRAIAAGSAAALAPLQNVSSEISPAAKPVFVSLFNGRDLTGWAGDSRVWSAVNGVIRGRLAQKTTAGMPSALIWRGGMVQDFELQFSFRLLQAGNSGVYYRAVELPNFDVGGYQFEIMRGNLGSLFDVGNDRKRRDLRRINSGSDVDHWHDARISVSGHHITHSLDGRTLLEVDDTGANAPSSGAIALEITSGPAYVEFKDLRLLRRDGVREAEIKSNGAGSDWIPLFDGTSLDAWQGWKGAGWIGAWEVLNGELRSLRGGTIDLATREQFGDFELQLEWKITPGANSGILYRAVPTTGEVWQSAPEYQIVDDRTHRDGRTPITATGSIYGVVPAENKVLKPPGEFNTTRILARGMHVEHWLNDRKILEADLSSPDVQRVAFQKFSKAAWGERSRGHIVLQQLGSEVTFRNIRVRKLD